MILDAAPGDGGRACPMTFRKSVLVWILMCLCAEGLGAQQKVTLWGRLLDADGGGAIEGAAVEIMDLGLAAVTDENGQFRIQGVSPGAFELRVRHIAYGVRTETIDIPVGQEFAIELRLSQQALELEAIDVEVLRRVPTASSRSNVVTRAQIEALQGRARHIGDVVRSYIPGATPSEARGGYLCLEFRGARNSRTTGCNYPLIVIDGISVPNPGRFLRDLRLEDLERIEFVPASEGGVRYGLGATYGVLVIETRRSGILPDTRPPQPTTYPSYPWSSEEGSHRSFRTFAGATLGAVIGTTLGLAAIGCLPGSDDSGGACIEGADTGAGLAATTLPVLASSLGARLFGSTEASRGRLLPSLGMTALPAVLGYAVYVEGVKSDFRGERLLGQALVAVGVPLVATLADHLFRHRR